MLCRACARFCSSLPLHALPVQCRPSDGQAAMSATYFISCGTKSAKRAENPCPSRKYLASTAIYRLYTFCCQFARGFFRISDKKLFCVKALFRPVLLSRFSTVKVKLFHENLSQLHKLQEGGEKNRSRARTVSSPSPSLLRKSTSPKGRGLGKEMKFAWTAKGSHFGEMPSSLK